VRTWALAGLEAGALVSTPGYARRTCRGKSFGPGFDSRRLHHLSSCIYVAYLARPVRASMSAHAACAIVPRSWSSRTQLGGGGVRLEQKATVTATARTPQHRSPTPGALGALSRACARSTTHRFRNACHIPGRSGAVGHGFYDGREPRPLPLASPACHCRKRLAWPVPRARESGRERQRFAMATDAPLKVSPGWERFTPLTPRPCR
jgi:hypothetical protein